MKEERKKERKKKKKVKVKVEGNPFTHSPPGRAHGGLILSVVRRSSTLPAAGLVLAGSGDPSWSGISCVR